MGADGCHPLEWLGVGEAAPRPLGVRWLGVEHEMCLWKLWPKE